jgi:hypothetical protein
MAHGDIGQWGRRSTRGGTAAYRATSVCFASIIVMNDDSSWVLTRTWFSSCQRGQHHDINSTRGAPQRVCMRLACSRHVHHTGCHRAELAHRHTPASPAPLRRSLLQQRQPASPSAIPPSERIRRAGSSPGVMASTQCTALQRRMQQTSRKSGNWMRERGS